MRWRQAECTMLLVLVDGSGLICTSSPQKWLHLGPSCLGPKCSHFWIYFLAPTYKPLLNIVISSLFCYILSVFEISFLGMGLRPSTYSEPFLQYRIQPGGAYDHHGRGRPWPIFNVSIIVLRAHVLSITYIYLYLESNIDYLLYQQLNTSLNSNSVHDL